MDGLFLLYSILKTDATKNAELCKKIVDQNEKGALLTERAPFSFL